MVAACRIQHIGEVWTKMPRGQHNTRVDGVWTRKEAIRQKFAIKRILSLQLLLLADIRRSFQQKKKSLILR